MESLRHRQNHPMKLCRVRETGEFGYLRTAEKNQPVGCSQILIKAFSDSFMIKSGFLFYLAIQKTWKLRWYLKDLKYSIRIKSLPKNPFECR